MRARPWWLGSLSVAIALVLAVASGVAGSMRDHDGRLADVERQLAGLPTIDGARVVDRGTRLGDGRWLDLPGGLLPSSGDHCEYRAWLVLATELGVDGVDRAYEEAGADLSGASIGLDGPGRVRVEQVETGRPGWDPRCNAGFGL